MPSNTADANTYIGVNKAAKLAGYRHFEAFLESYGLRIEDPDDIQEGKAILRGMGYKV